MPPNPSRNTDVPHAGAAPTAAPPVSYIPLGLLRMQVAQMSPEADLHLANITKSRVYGRNRRYRLVCAVGVLIVILCCRDAAADRVAACATLNGKFNAEGSISTIQTGMYKTTDTIAASEPKAFLSTLAPNSDIFAKLVSVEVKEAPTQYGAKGLRMMRRPVVTQLAKAVTVSAVQDAVHFAYYSDSGVMLADFEVPLGRKIDEALRHGEDWKCVDQRLVRTYEQKIGGEGSWGTSLEDDELYTNADGNLVWQSSAKSTLHFLIGGESGDYHHTRLFRRLPN